MKGQKIFNLGILFYINQNSLKFKNIMNTFVQGEICDVKVKS